MKAVVVFGVLCLGIHAQLPTPCQSPLQWEGRLLRVDVDRSYRQSARLTYDGLNQRIRKFEENDQGPDHEFLDVIYLYKENKEYRLDLRTRKCNVTTPRHAWRPLGVPPGATFEGSALLGASGLLKESLDVNTFSGKLNANTTFAGVVTAAGCLPVQLDYITTNGTKTDIEHNTFYDITYGIRDASVFDRPTECAP